jgi:hypothetical protein
MVWNKRRQDPTHVSSYPTYDMAYLARTLTDINTRPRTKYGAPGGLDLADKMVYMQKAAADVRAEADEALQNEFSLWLQGKHPDNAAPAVYDNSKPGVTERRQFMNGAIGPRGDWKPTWWGRGQLTHLPGVRDYLRAKKLQSEQSTLDLNQLAEFGPQNIEQAWAYFKTWVKGMPQSESLAVETPPNLPDLGAPRPLGGPKADHHFHVYNPDDAPYGGREDAPEWMVEEEPAVKIEPPGPSGGGMDRFADVMRGAMGKQQKAQHSWSQRIERVLGQALSTQTQQFQAQTAAQESQHSAMLRMMENLVLTGAASNAQLESLRTDLAQQRTQMQQAHEYHSTAAQTALAAQSSAARQGDPSAASFAAFTAAASSVLERSSTNMQNLENLLRENHSQILAQNVRLSTDARETLTQLFGVNSSESRARMSELANQFREISGAQTLALTNQMQSDGQSSDNRTRAIVLSQKEMQEAVGRGLQRVGQVKRMGDTITTNVDARSIVFYADNRAFTVLADNRVQTVNFNDNRVVNILNQEVQQRLQTNLVTNNYSAVNYRTAIINFVAAREQQADGLRLTGQPRLMYNDETRLALVDNRFLERATQLEEPLDANARALVVSAPTAELTEANLGQIAGPSRPRGPRTASTVVM